MSEECMNHSMSACMNHSMSGCMNQSMSGCINQSKRCLSQSMIGSISLY